MSSQLTGLDLEHRIETCSFCDVCIFDGEPYSAPFGANTHLTIVDLQTWKIRHVDLSQHCATGVRCNFSGICAAEGKIYLAPCRVPRLLVFDPITCDVSAVDISSVATCDWCYAGICSLDGKIYAAPHCASSVLVYDPIKEQVFGIDVSMIAFGTAKWWGICACEGWLYCAPHEATSILCIEPHSRSVRGVELKRKNNCVGICALDGTIYAAPDVGSDLLVLETHTMHLTQIDVRPIMGKISIHKFRGICALEGKIFAAPYGSEKLLMYDPSANALSGVDVVATGTYRFYGICGDETDGTLYAAPCEANEMLVYEVLPTKAVVSVDIQEHAGDQWELLCTCLNGEELPRLDVDPRITTPSMVTNMLSNQLGLSGRQVALLFFGREVLEKSKQGIVLASIFGCDNLYGPMSPFPARLAYGLGTYSLRALRFHVPGLSSISGVG